MDQSLDLILMGSVGLAAAAFGVYRMMCVARDLFNCKAGDSVDGTYWGPYPKTPLEPVPVRPTISLPPLTSTYRETLEREPRITH